MTVLREVLARFGLQIEGAEKLRSMTSGIDGAVGALRTLGAALAGGAVVKSLTSFAMHMAEVGGELEDSSKVLGVNTQALQEWRYAAKLVGVGTEELNGSLMIFNRNLDEAGQGSKAQAEAFKRLGVNIKDPQGNLRDIDGLLTDVAQAFSQMENGSEKAGAASALFGRSGAKLLPLLSQGAEGVAELKREFYELGGGATPEMIEAADAFGDEVDRMDTALLSLKAHIATFILPAFTRVVNVAKDAIGWFTRLSKNSHIVELALGAAAAAATYFGGAFLAGFAGPIAIAAVFAVAIGAVILVVDDLITLFEGGQSVLGAFIDEMFGVGTAAEIVQDLKDAWDGAVMAISDAKFALADFLGLDTSGMEPPWWAKPGVVNLGEIQDNQDKSAAKAGTLTKRPGESMDQARERFLANRKAAIAAGEIDPTRADREAGIVARRRPRVAAQARTVAEPRGAGSVTNANTKSVSVDARQTNTIQIPAGSDKALLDKMEQRLRRLNEDQNRRAAAALAQEAEEE